MLARGDWSFSYTGIPGDDGLVLKSADEVNLEVQDSEEGSSNVAVIASSSIFGLTLCAYFVYKKCMNGKQISDDFQRVWSLCKIK